MNKIFIIIILILNLSFTNLYGGPTVNARTAIVVDYHSDQILYELEPDAQIYPASMTKIMTSIIAFDLLIKKTISLDFNELIKSLYLLMKPRVMSLVLFTCMVGLIIAPNNVSYLNSILSLIAVALGAGAAGTLNMWYESDLDALMTRTCLRPIPTGQVTKNQALFFGVLLSIGSISLLYFSSNLMSASLLLLTI